MTCDAEPMSWLLAGIYDGFMRKTEEACLGAWRAELLRPASGNVLEIGAGTGTNLPHYGERVERLVLAEPDPHMRRKLAQKVERSSRSIEVVAAGAESLLADDGSFDWVVSTLVLCSVGDVESTLREVWRVLKPGGALAFLEHVAADDRPERLAWQRRIEPVWCRIAAGCHLTRRTHLAIVAQGFEIESMQRESVRKALPFVRPSVRGIARKPRPQRAMDAGS